MGCHELPINGTNCALVLQGHALHQDHGRGPPLSREPRAGPHPEPDRVLPDEYPHHAALHLPESARRERPQHQGTHRRRLGLVGAGERGAPPCAHVSSSPGLSGVYNLVFGGFFCVFFVSMPNV